MTVAKTRKRFNAETFAKVRHLHEQGTTEGERTAAGARMKALAESAGLSLAEAIARTDPPKPPAPVNIFEELFRSPAFQAQQAARQARRAAVRQTALAALGSEEAVWALTERERVLKAACAPLVTKKAIIGGEMDTLQGWSSHGRYSSMTKAVQSAISGAIPVETLRAAWSEYQDWENLYTMREAFCDLLDGHQVWGSARVAYLEHLLDTLPAHSMGDLRARLDWMDYLNDRESHRGNPEDGALLAQLRDDIERMGARLKDAEARAAGRSTPET